LENKKKTKREKKKERKKTFKNIEIIVAIIVAVNIGKRVFPTFIATPILPYKNLGPAFFSIS